MSTVITAKGEHVETSNTQETDTAQAMLASEQPKPTKKARAMPQGAHIAPKKGKSRKKTSPPKKGPKGQKKASAAREGSKTAKALDLLQRSGGATLKELMKALNWQAHSVRGFLSGTIGKKMGLAVTSTKGEDDQRRYSVSL